jgi:hypothetical protein
VKYLIRRVKRQEERTAREIGGRTTPASGAVWSAKGDATSATVMAECKQTEKKSYALRSDVLEKLLREAYTAAKMPLLQVQFTGPKGGRYAVLPWNELLTLIDKAGEWDKYQTLRERGLDKKVK